MKTLLIIMIFALSGCAAKRDIASSDEWKNIPAELDALKYPE